METHAPGAHGDLSGTESSQKFQMIESYMKSNDSCHRFRFHKLPFFFGLVGTGAPCTLPFLGLGMLGMLASMTSGLALGPPALPPVSPQHHWDLFSLDSWKLKLLGPFKIVPAKAEQRLRFRGVLLLYSRQKVRRKWGKSQEEWDIMSVPKLATNLTVLIKQTTQFNEDTSQLS